ncbi:Major Facilitator Superfamily protein [Trichomonas vaginalis G3]|uniref:Major Facilitator Superfamily protein n=1 Tax=Trichomonas vaginalis (strain ATCC PRA-98 / G3) TaxID=412133 RepID=A2FH47_TRIV3|nr:major facilitator superfamily transporter [Trichomonas vaginalis G3]EAX95772.1 Major Facilitator Superfamily protein [Trichomonas vaginalis G3]KAI5515009.1 glucose import [Trichomonas vaginalis G3]|eukprot:XP_001308702.1 major facilitator superfamily transporter [Trichomonas vaginalis G3]
MHSQTAIYASVACIMGGSFIFGNSIAFSALTMPGIIKYFELKEIEATLFSSLIALFAIAGPLIFQPFMVMKGRKFTFCLITILSLISWLLFSIVTPSTKYLIFIHRISIGIAVGAYSFANPVYLVELANDHQKGLFGTLNQLGISAGVVSANILGGLLYWRYFAILVLILTICICLFSFIIADTTPAPANEKNSGNGSYSSLFSNYKLELLEGVMYQIFQQFSGINGILTNAGMLLNGSTTAATFGASAQLIAVFFCSSAISYLGTKKIWIIACSGAALSLLILAVSQTFDLGLIVNGIAVFGFQLSFGFGLGPLPFTISPTLFPDSVRAQANSILTLVNWLLAFIVISIFPSMLNYCGLGISSMMFAGVMVAGIIFGLKQSDIRDQNSEPFEADVELNNEEDNIDHEL